MKHQATNADAGRAASTGNAALAGTMRGTDAVPRLLLVEDDATTSAFLAAAASALPAQVDTADSVATALELATHGEYALWMFDAQLPDGRGSDLLLRLRARHPHTPALAHTADREASSTAALLAAGFAEVLVKPLPASTVRDALRRLLGDAVADTPERYRPEPGEPGLPALPVWDDEVASRALNGNREHIASLRQLFLDELPQAREVVLTAANSGDVAAVRGQLHKLSASCGFVGAARLAACVEALREHPEDGARLAAFERCAGELLDNAAR
ncbi:response regulator [Montanilutibacter psychrotolerans]|nr:response regulator [Lysobacter psychrotolerans]